MQTVIRFRPPRRVDGVPPIGQVATGDGTFEVHVDEPTEALHELTGWALEHGARFDLLEVTQPTLEDVYLRAHRRRAGDASERGRPDAAAGAVHEQVVLAQSGVGVLHVRVPADVPGDLHGAARAAATSASRERTSRQTTYYVVAMATFGVISRLLHEHRDQRVLQPRRGDPEANAGDAAPRLVVPVGPRDPRDDRRRHPRRHHAACSGGRSTTGRSRWGPRCLEFVVTFAGRRAVVRRPGARAHRRRSRTPTRRRRS